MKNLIGTIALGMGAVVLAGAFAYGVTSAERQYWQDAKDDRAYVEELFDESVPRCTDKIADAHGVCQGEPLPPCTTEDAAYDCYWDAATMGNGYGRSFIVENDVVTYTD